MYLPTTHIGGLPYTGENSIQKAVDLSVECFDIPFLPELGSKGDNIDSPIKNPGKLSCLDEFVKRIGDGTYETVKIQIAGPVTAYKYDKYFSSCIDHLNAIKNVLPSNIKEVVVFADEPSLSDVVFDFDYECLHKDWLAIAESLKTESFKIKTGIHSCGDLTDRMELRRFDALFNSEINIINVDASKYDTTKYPNYRGDENKSKRIAWGVDFGNDLRFKNINEIVEYLGQHAQDGDLLTPPCGWSHRLYNEGDVMGGVETLKAVQSRLNEL